MHSHEHFMRRALELASLGMGSVSPNPLVGCVIVHEGRIIGEGYHEYYGGPHAEPNAINSVKDPSLLPFSTVYVTLEPCAHWGKTPPCANLLVEKKVKKVVIGALDSNPLVAGKGVKILESAAIEVESGILEDEVREQNRRFFTFMENKRPYIILKWAQTRDGFVARTDYDSKWISNAHSRQLVHRWRTEEDAIMVGRATAQHDNPRLNVRDWTGKNPIRVVLDSSCQLDTKLNLFDQSQPTLVYNHLRSEETENLSFVQLEKGFGVREILDDLYIRKVQSLIVEGGSQVLNSFLSSRLWDEARVFTGATSFGEGIAAPIINGTLVESLSIQGDLLQVFKNKS